MATGPMPFAAAGSAPARALKETKIPAQRRENRSDRPPELDPLEAAGLLSRGEAEMIDVREPYERSVGYIAGSRHIPLGLLASAAEALDPTRTVIFQCRVGARSALAAEAFRRAGYDSYNLRGGIVAWARAGLPLMPEGAYVADH